MLEIVPAIVAVPLWKRIAKTAGPVPPLALRAVAVSADGLVHGVLIVGQPRLFVGIDATKPACCKFWKCFFDFIGKHKESC